MVKALAPVPVKLNPAPPTPPSPNPAVPCRVIEPAFLLVLRMPLLANKAPFMVRVISPVEATVTPVLMVTVPGVLVVADTLLFRLRVDVPAPDCANITDLVLVGDKVITPGIEMVPLEPVVVLIVKSAAPPPEFAVNAVEPEPDIVPFAPKINNGDDTVRLEAETDVIPVPIEILPPVF